jgi:hypothetical protein
MFTARCRLRPNRTNRERTALVALALLLAVSSLAPALAQPADAPTNCTEAMFSATIFIGHDCGEWASVVIAGNIIIRKPWSRANRASRAVRIRANRGDETAPAEEPTRTPKPNRTPKPRRTPASGDTTMFGVDISSGNPDELDCPDFRYQEDAQELFDAQGWSPTNDPYGLDSRGEGDGVPCEENPHRP